MMRRQGPSDGIDTPAAGGSRIVPAPNSRKTRRLTSIIRDLLSSNCRSGRRVSLARNLTNALFQLAAQEIGDARAVRHDARAGSVSAAQRFAG